MFKKFIRDIAVYAPSQFLPALTAFITTPILTRVFPPDEYGYWSLAQSISDFLVALAVSGYGSAVLRYYPIYETKSALNVFFATITGSISITIGLISVAIVLILLLFGNLIPAGIAPYVYFIIFIFIAQSFHSIFLTVIRTQGRSKVYTTFQLTTKYADLGLGLILVLVFGLRVNGLLWGTLITLSLLVPILIHEGTSHAGINFKFFKLTDAIDIWHYAWPLTLGNVAMWGLKVSDLFIISLFRPEQEVGIYSVSYNISSKSIELLVALFLLSVSPLVYSTWEKEGQEATERTVTMITRIYLLLCLPAAVGLTVLGLPFVSLLASPEYFEGAKVIGFVVFSSFIWGMSNIAMLGVAIKKKAGRLGTNQIIAAAVHIGLQILFVPRFGYIAAAVSTLIGYTTLFVLQALASRPHLTWRFPFRTLKNVLISSAVMTLAILGFYALIGAFGADSPVFLFVCIILVLPVYFGSLWVVGEPANDEKKVILEYWNRLRGRAS